QAGQGVTGMRIADPVDSHDEQFWLWQALAHGAREIAVYAWYPMSSGYESGGYGLINLDGSLTDRARAAGQVAGIVEKYSADFLAAKPASASVAILSNRLSSMVGGAEPSLSRLGNAERDSLMGLHRAFFEPQIPVDFVDPSDVTRGRLGQYKILFLPFPVMLSRDVAEGVERFVKNGGTAVAEARLAWNDERGDASDIVPGAGLDEVFGAREKMIRPFEKLHLFIEPSPELPGFAPREVISTTGFEEDLEPLPGARVLARFSDGAAGVVANTYGRGKAILIGSFPALAYQREHDGSTRRLLLALAESAGVKPEVEVTGSGSQDVEVRRLTSDRAELLFAFNHSTTTPADATISLRLPWPVAEARDLVADSPIALEPRDGGTALHKKLAVGEILVVRLERR
ncbi:MAG TPA: beta-galactosidase trimerization domain-containing protein, partial [Terriglobia bacterium]|nr:beta-galactosidase trimerization domain-containing protein [Terriglobia bacterium]